MPEQIELFNEHYFVVPPDQSLPPRLADLFRERAAFEGLGEALNPFNRGSKPLWDSIMTIENQIRDEWPFEVVRGTKCFTPIRQFLQDYSPVRDSFDVYYSDYGTPVRIVYSFSGDQLDSINAAVAEAVPFLWCEDGEHQRPVFLFGVAFWELSKKEANATKRDVELLFSRIARDRSTLTISLREVIPEAVKFLVWRRDSGRCVHCGSQTRLEFDHIIPVSKGGSSTARNVQLLCEACNRKKCDQI